MKKRYLWILCSVALALVLCLVMLWRIERRIVVSIDGIESPRGEEIAFGRGSDVCFNRIPHDFLLIRQNDGGFSWHVNPAWAKSDSLCYFKVNNVNPNLHTLSDDATIDVSVGKNTLSYPVSRIREVLSGHDSHYVMLRNMMARDKWLRKDSADATDYKTQRQLRSFFFRDDTSDRWQLVILDRYTTLRQADKSAIAYCMADSIRGADARQCKIQFFQMAEYSIRPDKPDGSLFSIGDVNYLAKPLLVSTQWGSGHVTIASCGEKNEIRFSKPVTFTTTTGHLRKMSASSAQLITLQQADGSFPMPGSVYLPMFSSAVPNDVCNIHLSGDSIIVSGHPVSANSGLTPGEHAFRQAVPGGALLVHTQVISMGYILSYLWLPLLMLVVVVLGYTLSMAPGTKDMREVFSARSHLTRQMVTVAAIAFVYCVCKVMIALKLSFSYPYFSQIGAIVVASATMILSLLYLLSLIINHHLLVAKGSPMRGAGQSRRWIAVGMGVVALCLCYYALHTISTSLTASYLPEETGGWQFWNWSQLTGVTDTYLSVPYTLMLCNVVALIVLAAINIDPVSYWLRNTWLRLCQWLQQRVPRTVFVLSPCVAVLIVSVIPGNFSTAFITLFVILGMSWSLRQVTFEHGRMKGFLQMLAITLVYLVAAILLGDKGYVTNYLGFVAAAILLYFMSSKGSAPRHEGRYTLLIAAGALLLALFVAPRLMPLKYDVDSVSYDRTSRRFEMFAQFDKYVNSGYRYAVADAEFMTVLTHYMYNIDGSDPLSVEKHSLHPSVSTGQSPVVVNDVAVPCCFFGTYGLLAYLVFFGLLVLLSMAVLSHGMRLPRVTGDIVITPQRMWCILALMMWVGTTIYLYASYVGGVPFTGRLCPGLGVDAVGEAIESCLLLAFMTADTWSQNNPQSP